MWDFIKKHLSIKLEALDKFYVLLAIYFATYAFSPILSAGKDINFFGYPLMPGSLMLIFNTSIISLIQDNYGKDAAKKMVVGGIIGRLFVWSFTLIVLMLPSLHEVPGYDKIVSSGFRILLAGITARYFGQLLIDIPLFQKVRGATKSFAWAYIAAMLVNIFIERAIFVIIAKAGTGGNLFDRFIAHSIVSIIFVVLLTPVVSFLNHVLFHKNNSIPVNSN